MESRSAIGPGGGTKSGVSHHWGAGGTIPVDDEMPFPQREDLMSMDKLHPADTLRGDVRCFKLETLSLKTKDIPGCRPSRTLPRNDMRTFAHGCVDPQHPGCRAETKYPPVYRRPRDLSLTTSDLPHAHPEDPDKLVPGSRVVDPLQPLYQMLSSSANPESPSRHSSRRHATDISDIDGTRPRKLYPARSHRRDPCDVSDICPPSGGCGLGGSESRREQEGPPRPRSRGGRVTDPLDPAYRWDAPVGPTSLVAGWEEHLSAGWTAAPGLQNITQRQLGLCYGSVERSKPRRLHRGNGEPQRSLVSGDIDGARPQRWLGAQPFSLYDSHELRPSTSFHDPSDIPGARACTLRRGLKSTGRSTNPLDPVYAELGEKHLSELPLLETERGGQRFPSWGKSGEELVASQ